VKGIGELVREVRAFDGLAPEHLDLIAGCGRTASFRDGELILREGDDADVFYAIREGTVALEAASSAGFVTIETLDAGEVVGWSWLFERRTRFDARARGTVHAIEFDGTCLRGKCEADHELGYELLRRFGAVVVERLQATRMRLLDLYGAPGG
jgi:CRP/FNR family transcriptional regulator, cyclic AMP receptor protein